MDTVNHMHDAMMSELHTLYTNYRQAKEDNDFLSAVPQLQQIQSLHKEIHSKGIMTQRDILDYFLTYINKKD